MLQEMFEKHGTANGREPDNVPLLFSLESSLLLGFFGFVLLLSCLWFFFFPRVVHLISETAFNEF